jgi:hypothetical protein
VFKVKSIVRLTRQYRQQTHHYLGKDKTMIELKLSIDQVNQILAILGDLPIKTGLTGLAVEIQQQAQPQVQQDQPEE